MVSVRDHDPSSACTAVLFPCPIAGGGLEPAMGLSVTKALIYIAAPIDQMKSRRSLDSHILQISALDKMASLVGLEKIASTPFWKNLSSDYL